MDGELTESQKSITVLRHEAYKGYERLTVQCL